MTQFSNLKRLALGLLLTAFVGLGSALSAKADTINIVGNTNGALATATVTCSFNAQTNTFTFTILNTSPFDARITGIGFDLPGTTASTFSGSVDFQPSGVDFDFTDVNDANVPQFDDAVLDFSFITGNAFAGGNPPTGLPPGIDPGDEATFTVSGTGFAGLTEEQICNAIFVRFQQVGANGQLSDVGTPGTPIPEPASMLLLGTGLIGVAGAARRKFGTRK